jgi:hypothetical protein
MARLNTANPLVNGTHQKGSGVVKNTQHTSRMVDDSQPSEEPCSHVRKPTTKHSVHTTAQNQSRRQTARSSTLFNILPDSESTSECESRQRKPTGKQIRPRTLGIARVNSLLLPAKQRPRPTFRETADYDKENDIPEHGTDGYRTPDSTPSRQPTPRQNASQTPGRSITRDIGTRQPVADDQEEEIEDQGYDDSFDSLDDFIVSDNEELSSHEASDHETPDTEDEPIPTVSAISPIRSPRKRLVRGRRPASETELNILADEKPSREMTDSELELDNTNQKPTTATPKNDDFTPSPVLSFQPEPPVYDANDSVHQNDLTHPLKSQLYNHNDLIQHLETLDLESDEDITPQPNTTKYR